MENDTHKKIRLRSTTPAMRQAFDDAIYPPQKQSPLVLAQQSYWQNQNIEKNLMKIANDPKINTALRKLPILNILRETAKDLILNTLEIAVWSIYLDRYVWAYATEQNIKSSMLFWGFAAKTYLNEDFKEIQQNLSIDKMNNFSEKYNDWLKQYRTGMAIPCREINDRYFQITTAIDLEQDMNDYRYLVDDIINVTNTDTPTQEQPIDQPVEKEYPPLGLRLLSSSDVIRNCPSLDGSDSPTGWTSFLPIDEQNFSTIALKSRQSSEVVDELPELSLKRTSLVSSLFTLQDEQ